MRHAELEGRHGPSGMPAIDAQFGEQLVFTEDLIGIKRLGRRMILGRLREVSPLIDDLVESETELPLRPSISVTSSITIGDRPVGIRLPEVIRIGKESGGRLV